MSKQSESFQETRRLRRACAVLVAAGAAGTGAELVLIEHLDGLWQAAPVVVLALSVLVFAWDLASDRWLTRTLVQLVMLLLFACGVWGAYLHYRSNAEFQVELDPDLNGAGLVLAALRSHSPPSLAPGALALLALFGLLAVRGRS